MPTATVGIIDSAHTVAAPTAGYKKFIGFATATTNVNTTVITTTDSIDVGDLIVIRIATDNSSSVGPTFVCVDSVGNNYAIPIHKPCGLGVSLGVNAAIFISKAQNAMAAGGTITITQSTATSHKAMYVESFTGFSLIVRSTPVATLGPSTTPSVTSGTVNAGDLVIGCITVESWAAFSGDSDTLNGAWSTQYRLPSLGSGTDTTAVEVSGQHKIATASGAQTYDSTLSTPATTDWNSLIVVLQPDVVSSFVPTDLSGLETWLDANDAATITYGTSPAVASWTSKAANGWVFSQSTGSAQPTRVLGGLRSDRYSLVFASTQELIGPSPSGVNTKPFHAFAVVKHTAATAVSQTWFATFSNGGMIWYKTTTHKQQMNADFTVTIGSSNTVLPINQAVVVAVSYSSVGELSFWYNGVADGTLTNNASFTSPNGASKISKGTTPGITIGEIIKYDRLLSESEREQVEFYLAGKWR